MGKGFQHFKINMHDEPGPLAQGGVPSGASRLGCETITFRALRRCKNKDSFCVLTQRDRPSSS